MAFRARKLSGVSRNGPRMLFFVYSDEMKTLICLCVPGTHSSFHNISVIISIRKWKKFHSLCFCLCLCKGGEIRDTKTLNLSRNIVAFQVFGRCFSFFTLHNQLVAQQKHLLRVEESCCSKYSQVQL